MTSTRDVTAWFDVMVLVGGFSIPVFIFVSAFLGIFSLMLIYKEKKSDFSFLVEKVARMFADLARYY